MIKNRMTNFYIAAMMIWTCTVKAQGDNKSIIHKIGLDACLSYVTPTSKFLKDDGYGDGLTLCKAASFHLRYGFQLNPSSEEGQFYPYTYQGVAVSHNTFGNRQEVGSPRAAYVFQSSRIAKIFSRLFFDYGWSSGASFGWHLYDDNNGYRNKIIDSKINAYINPGLFLSVELSRYCNLLVGADLMHYSNGNAHLPNAGLDTIGGRIELAYAPNPIEESHHEIDTARSLPKNQLYLSSFWQRISYDVTLYSAIRVKGAMLNDETHIFPGHFDILRLNLNPIYKSNRFLKAGIPLNSQYDESTNIYSDEIVQVGEGPRFYRSSLHEQVDIGPSARDEFMVPFFSIDIGVGHSLLYGKGNLKRLYQTLALKASVTRNLFLHVRYQLHRFHNLNNLMLEVGYRFHN